MSEYILTYLSAGNVALLSIATLLYSLGGRSNKAQRRFGASFIIALAINGTSLIMGKWWWPLLFIYPIKIAEYSLGYGGDVLWVRLVKRFLIVLLALSCGGLCMFVLGDGFYLFLIQVIAGLTTIMFGWKNPIAASAEEVLICFLNSGILLFYPFIV